MSGHQTNVDANTILSTQIANFPTVTIADFAANPGRRQKLASLNEGGFYAYPTTVGASAFYHDNAVYSYDMTLWGSPQNDDAKWDRTSNANPSTP